MPTKAPFTDVSCARNERLCSQPRAALAPSRIQRPPWIGVLPPGATLTPEHRSTQVPEDNSFHHYAVSKMKADEHLRNSRHRHTILKPAALTDDELGEIEIGDEEETNPGTTSREAVATLIARYANEGPSGDVCFVD